MPMPLAASVTAGSTLASPTMVFRVIGNNAYKTNAITVGVAPNPTTGISNPSNANDGMVKTVLANAVATAEPTGLRYTAIPIPTPGTAAMIVDCTTSLTCRNA